MWWRISAVTASVLHSVSPSGANATQRRLRHPLRRELSRGRAESAGRELAALALARAASLAEGTACLAAVWERWLA